ncbi:MAG: transposase [Gemmatimonadaceae bacterium]|nr:transposase [Gemmatimonadaceae bacterium]
MPDAALACGEQYLAVGIVACLQSHGSRRNWHPHRHLLVTDGGSDRTWRSCRGQCTTPPGWPRRSAAPCFGFSCVWSCSMSTKPPAC